MGALEEVALTKGKAVSSKLGGAGVSIEDSGFDDADAGAGADVEEEVKAEGDCNVCIKEEEEEEEGVVVCGSGDAEDEREEVLEDESGAIKDIKDMASGVEWVGLQK
mmetsp:Transcript_3178/g.7647  ORF Transcript_3178/g.7647 Transcript_3178/m.7647 type:complete len:107 (+) Transcript_3178:2241-2561(+)|eukprot:768429-Hanusia_phi.AAC.2